MAELSGVDVRTVSDHMRNIYESGELAEEATLRKIRRVQREGNREVSRVVDFYNLDAIISVGYRVNNAQATQFRIWATVASPLQPSSRWPRLLPALTDGQALCSLRGASAGLSATGNPRRLPKRK